MGKNTSGLTLWDVAHAAGVSLGTASRVINGGKNVSPAMLEKVQASILKLGYEPNQTARALASGRTSMVGLLVPSIADPFFSNCAEAAEKVARKYDSLLILAVSNNDVATEREKLSALLRQRPDGLLVVPSDGENITFRRFVRDTRVPIVTFDRPTAGCPSVLTDNYDAALKATINASSAMGESRISTLLKSACAAIAMPLNMLGSSNKWMPLFPKAKGTQRTP